jgi:hypothetical protein
VFASEGQICCTVKNLRKAITLQAIIKELDNAAAGPHFNSQLFTSSPILDSSQDTKKGMDVLSYGRSIP